MATGYEKITSIKNKLKKTRMTVEQLAVALDCQERTIYRHLDAIQKENCGLHKIKEQGQTFYTIQIEEEKDFHQDVVKQLERLKKSIVGKSAMDVKNSKLIDKIIEMLKGTDPEQFKAELLSFDPNFIMDPGPFSDTFEQDATITKILESIRDGFKIKVSYRRSGAGTVESMVICPVKLIYRIDTLYLVYLDNENEDTFKNMVVKNIETLSRTEQTFALKPFSADVHYRHAFGKWTNANEKVLDISLQVNDTWLQTQFRKSHFSPKQEIRESKNRFVVNLKLRNTPDFQGWLFGILPHIEILKPESLKQDMIKIAKDALKKLEGK
ncbi:MAG: WYL domain-containing protein [Fibrobacteraceae bacterium]|nr:WYL domain-containing protein [Fibrobacteraceae bacterium]